MQTRNIGIVHMQTYSTSVSFPESKHQSLPDCMQMCTQLGMYNLDQQEDPAKQIVSECHKRRMLNIHSIHSTIPCIYNMARHTTALSTGAVAVDVFCATRLRLFFGITRYFCSTCGSKLSRT